MYGSAQTSDSLRQIEDLCVASCAVSKARSHLVCASFGLRGPGMSELEERRLSRDFFHPGLAVISNEGQEVT